MGTFSRSNWNLECWFLKRGENRSTRRKTSRSKERTNNKLNPHMTPRPRIEPGPRWWEASALTTAPSLLPHSAEIEIFWCPDCQMAAPIAFIGDSLRRNLRTCLHNLLLLLQCSYIQSTLCFHVMVLSLFFVLLPFFEFQT